MKKSKKKAELNKTKLKNKSIKLPKGLNATKTDFKVFKVVIKEQLQDYKDGEIGRKANLKDILNRLKHHNSNSSLDALRSLKVLNLRSANITQQMNEIVLGVAALALENDREVRRESFKILGSILADFSENEIKPFFHIILHHLRCAMTHIKPSIQEDSLILFDVILHRVPKLVARDSNILLNNFLSMISKVSPQTKNSRSLIGKIGNNKFHIQVLDRLRVFLKAKLECDLEQSKSKHDKTDVKIQVFHENDAVYFPVTNRNQKYHYDLSYLFVKSTDSKTTISSETESDNIKNYITLLMPLLFNAWLEVRPLNNDRDMVDDEISEVFLPHDTACTLTTILEIIEIVWSLIKFYDVNNNLQCWFQKEYANKFMSTFFNMFPYKQFPQSSKKTKSKRKKELPIPPCIRGEICVQQNIILSYLACVLNEQNTVIIRKNISKIVKFLKKLLFKINIIDVSYWSYMEKALRVALYGNAKCLLQCDERNTKLLLRTVISSFLNGNFGQYGTGNIIAILCDIVQLPHLCKMYGLKELQNWVSYLPELLLKRNLSRNTLSALTTLAKQKNTTFLHSLRMVTESVIENLQTIQVGGCSDDLEGKRMIINLFFWIDDYTKDEKDIFTKKIKEFIADETIIGYFLFVVNFEHC